MYLTDFASEFDLLLVDEYRITSVTILSKVYL